MFDPAHDVERRKLKTKERRDSMDTTLYTSTTEDEATEQRELEEAIVDTYWNSMDKTIFTRTQPKKKKTFSALLLSVLISCSMIPQKDKFYNYSDLNGNNHIFKEDLYKLRETEYWYCYEHETLHELEVIQIANTTTFDTNTK